MSRPWPSCKQLAADFPTRPEFRQALAGIHSNLGNLLLLDAAAAEGSGGGPRRGPGDSKAARRRLPRPAHTPPGPGQSHNNLGWLFQTTRRPKKAESAFGDAVALQKQAVADFPDRPEFRSGTGQVPLQPGQPAPRHGAAEGSGGGLWRGPGDPEATRCRVPQPARVPPGVGRRPQQPGPLCSATRGG